MVKWLWKEQHAFGTSVGWQIVAAALGMPMQHKKVYDRMEKIPDVFAVLEYSEGRLALWSYYVGRDPNKAQRAKVAHKSRPLR